MSYEKLSHRKVTIQGKDDPKTLECLVQLAWVLQQAKKYKRSEFYYRWLYEAQVKNAGEDDPFSLMIANNLGCVLGYQGNMEEALHLLLRAYEGRKRTFGPRGHLTRKSMWTIASVLETAGRTEEAEEWYKRYNEASGLGNTAVGDGTDCAEPTRQRSKRTV